MICETWFNIQKLFDATIILSFDYLAAVLATYPKIGRFYFKFLVTLIFFQTPSYRDSKSAASADTSINLVDFNFNKTT
jgi:hypothetical protein